jgi:DNA (cytosine-5)-methyltransferase 1
MASDVPVAPWHPPVLTNAYERISATAKKNWLWWAPTRPAKRNTRFADVIENEPTGVRWHTREETRRLLRLMSPLNKAKVAAAKKAGRRMVGGVYRRMRPAEDGGRQQRAEVRFDDVAGCLRTPRGGSSRQTILVVDGPKVRSRLLSPREAARLMGLTDDYHLPARYNDAYHVAGDGVCVPVVRHIAQHILEPVLAIEQASELIAAE